jgi:hypothetical protein
MPGNLQGQRWGRSRHDQGLPGIFISKCNWVRGIQKVAGGHDGLSCPPKHNERGTERNEVYRLPNKIDEYIIPYHKVINQIHHPG